MVSAGHNGGFKTAATEISVDDTLATENLSGTFSWNHINTHIFKVLPVLKLCHVLALFSPSFEEQEGLTS